MKVLPVFSNYTKPVSAARAKNPNFTGCNQNSLFENLGKINMYHLYKNSICDCFESLMSDIRYSPEFVKMPGFNKLAKLYDAGNLRSTLYTLGEPDSPLLKTIIDGSKDYYGSHVLASVGKEKYLSIDNEGPWGFWNNLLGLKSKNEVILTFVNSRNNTSMEFGLDKANDYQIRISNGPASTRKILYYADKYGIKKEIEPKTDLYLPPGLY